MKIMTKPLLVAIAVSVAIANHAIAAYTPTVSAGTTVDGETIQGNTAQQNVYGTANSTTVNNGGTQNINSGGKSTSTTVNNGGVQNVNSGGTADSTSVNSGGKQLVTNGGIATSTTLNGGDQTVDRRGAATSTTVNNGSEQVVVDGGTATLTTVNNGGKQFVYTDGLATSTTVNNGGEQVVVNGGTATLTTVNNGGVENIYDRSRAASTTVNSGGTQNVNSGGTADSTTVNNGGYMYNLGGSDSNTTVNGGIYRLGFDANNNTYDNSMASNLTINPDGIVNINVGTLTGATVNGVMLVAPMTDINSIIHTPTLQGNISVNDAGKLTLTPGANTQNADITLTDSGGLYLASNAAVTGTYDFALGAMTMKGGNVYFDQVGGGDSQVGYSSLTLDSLDGSGSFYMNTNLASLQGDFLTIKGRANGDFDVYVADTGVSPTSDSSLQIIQTGGGNADFTLANNGHVVDVGTYQYYLVADGQGGWALSPQAKPEPTPTPISEPTPELEPTPEPTPNPSPVAPTITPSTAAVLSMATVAPLIFQAELSSVRSRLDQVRSFSHDTNVWGHYTANRYNVSDSAGAGYGMHVNGVTIGADKSKESDNGVSTQGLFFSYSHSDVDFDRSGDGNVDSYSVGAYASYLHNSGFYFDGVLKVNRFGNDVNGQMTSGEAANGYYNTTGLGVNLQGGKYFYFGDSYIAPYASVTGFTSNTSDYTLSNGMKAHVGSQRSVIGETGVSLGHQFVVQGAQVQPYLKLAVTQEFIDDNAVKVNGDHFTNDLSGTRGVYQLGVNAKATNRITVHADASYAQGSHVESPWTANLGASWSF